MGAAEVEPRKSRGKGGDEVGIGQRGRAPPGRHPARPNRAGEQWKVSSSRVLFRPSEWRLGPVLNTIRKIAILAETEICHGHRHPQRQRIPGPGDRSLSQPVLITKHGRPRNVVLSYDEYERLRARDRRAVRAEDLTDEDIAALEASEIAPGYEHLDAELEAK